MATKIDLGIIITSLNKSGPGLNNAARDVRRLDDAAKNATRNYRIFQAVVGGVLVQRSIELGQSFLETAGALQALQIRLAGVVGGASKANEVFGSLNEKFGAAPFDLTKIADGFVRIASSGLELKKVSDLTDAIVNAVAAFGGGTQELERVFIGFSQVIGKGTLQMEELRQQIGEQVPSALRLMANEAGLSTAEFIQQVSRGMVSGERAVQLFTDASKKYFGDFAKNMSSTIGGSMTRVVSVFNKAISDLIERTTFGARIAIIFNDIADKVKLFIDSLDEADVENFFNVLEALRASSEKMLKAVSDLAPALVALFSGALAVINAMPQDMIEGGIIGRFFFGKSGFAIGAIIGGLSKYVAAGLAEIANQLGVFSDDELRGFIEQMQTKGIFGGIAEDLTAFSQGTTAASMGLRGMQDEISETQERTRALANSVKALDPNYGFGTAAQKAFSELETMLERTRARADGALLPFLDDVTRSEDRIRKLSGAFSAEMARIKELSAKGTLTANEAKELDELQRNMAVVNATVSEIRANVGLAASREIVKFNDGIQDTITKLSLAIDVFGRGAESDELSQSIARINERATTYVERLQDALDKSIALNEVTGAQGEQIKKIHSLIEATNVGREQAIAKAKALYAVETDIFRLTSSNEQLRMRQQLLDIQREMNDNIMFGITQGTTGGKLALDIDNQRRQMMIELNDIQSQLLEKQNELTQTADPERRASIEMTVDSLQQLGDATRTAMNELSVQAALEKELWTSVGSAVESSLGSAIQGIITGTKTWKQVGLDLFNSLTKAASDYIAKLLLMKVLGSAVGFADGGVFSGSIKVKPFANGGIIGGPTLFGLAGEAGSEAIMPLERVGGKLGVRATGANDGGPVNLYLSAIDTQTGIEFLFKHKSDITTILRRGNNLNQGLNR